MSNTIAFFMLFGGLWLYKQCWFIEYIREAKEEQVNFSNITNEGNYDE